MNRKLLFTVFVLAALFSGCQKSLMSDLVKNTDLLVSDNEDYILKDAEIEEAIELADYEVDFFTTPKSGLRDFGKNKKKPRRGGKKPLGGRYHMDNCPDITIDSTETGYPKTITLNYGEGTELAHGKVLKGKIIIYVSDPPFTDGGTREITYEDFYVDSMNIAGNKLMTFIGDNSTIKLFSSSSDLIYTFGDGSTESRSSEKVRQWIAGIDTEFEPDDDIINITGSSLFVNKEGDEIQKLITEALVKTGACKYIIQGVVNFSINGETNAILDYGQGDCDNKAMLTKDGETKEIVLKRKGKR